MSFLRKMFSGKVGADDSRRYLVEAMLGAMEADGDVSEEEMSTFEATLAGHSLFEGLSGEEIGRLTDLAADAIREAGGGKGRFKEMAKGLPSRHQRLTAYAMACEVCVSDRALTETEIDFLDGLQHALSLEETEAKEVFEAARRHSGLLTLEEKSEKVRQLMPAFVKCMALMAAADEEIHHEERLSMRAVLRAIPDMQVLTLAEIDEAVSVALDRIAGKSSSAELVEIAKEVTLNADRYWVTVYTMIVALADGKTDWREDAFLATMRKTFGLSDKQMDLAMQVASQFPAVALGGEAPGLIMPAVWREELEAMLRPSAGGVYVVSTGRAQQAKLQRALYGVQTDEEVRTKFLAQLDRIPTARAVILGIPSDVGAGFVRGANMGPQVIRSALLSQVPDWAAKCEALGIVDIGDVFVVPQLLHDDMLSDAQKAATRKALYPTLPDTTLPVSPLSIAERALDLVLAQNPAIAPFIIGGDHSTAWPAVAALGRARKDRWSIVQPDAHTDLLEHRLGVKYCFATWSFHANELFGRDGRLVQVGTRASGRDRGHWESSLNVRQFWAEECRRKPAETIDAVIAHLRSVGASTVYFSNDIDGTDDSVADATGTPEPWGLEPDWVMKLIKRLGTEIGLCGGDIMEVAPPLRQVPRGAHRTTVLAARYFRQTIASTLGVEL